MIIYNTDYKRENMIYPELEKWQFYPFNEYDIKDMCFFDIETTGLSPETSNIYLIGAGYYTEDGFNIIQWFADDYKSEENILKDFFDFISDYKVIFQYNGNTFDIPFVKKKAKQYGMDIECLEGLKKLDLYVMPRKYAGMLGLPNKKLKSFEQYVGLIREDEADGGILIDVYVKYIHNKLMGKDDETMLHELLLHNYEDVFGLSQVASLLYLKDFEKLNVSFENCSLKDTELVIRYKCFVPYNCLFCVNDTIEVSCEDNEIIIRVRLFKDSLKYYFKDYKDYYYMLEEETVMHKSVAVYTDASVRRKAKKAECFVTKDGLYLPVFKPGVFSDNYHIFRKDYTAKDYYIDMDDVELKDDEFMCDYYRQVVNSI